MSIAQYAFNAERSSRASGRCRQHGVIPIVAAALALLATVSGTLSHVENDVNPPMKFGIPAYAYPTDGQLWKAIAALPAGSSIILDPADGPGKSVDPMYQKVLLPLRERGVKVYGYIDTAFGTRDVDTIMEEAKTYQAWYQPVGIFLDQTPGASSFLPTFRRIIAGLRALGYEVVLNPGQPVIDPEYAAMADHVINFEGTWQSYQKFRQPRWVQKFSRDKFWHLVHASADAPTMRRAVRLALQRHAGTIFVTDGTMPNPWNRVPSYWQEEIKLVGG